MRSMSSGRRSSSRDGSVGPAIGASYCRESTRTPSTMTIGALGPLTLVGPRKSTSAPSLAMPPERNTRTPGRRAWSSSEKVGAVDLAISAESMTMTPAPHVDVGNRSSGLTADVRAVSLWDRAAAGRTRMIAQKPRVKEPNLIC